MIMAQYSLCGDRKVIRLPAGDEPQTIVRMGLTLALRGLTGASALSLLPWRVWRPSGLRRRRVKDWNRLSHDL